MLPGFVESSSQSYKYDTATFLKWLNETARTCGYKSDAVPKSTRLKGKTRKEAKAAAGNAKSGPSGKKLDSPITYPVPIKDLVPSAEAIANFGNPPVLVPPMVLRAVLRTIRARKRCSAWFMRHSPGQKTKNDGHFHFANVLEDVLQALGPCLNSKHSFMSENEGSKSQVDINILLAAQDVEDRADTNSKPAFPESVPSTFYILEIPKDDDSVNDERLFAIFCLFQDLNDIRSSVKRLWSDYKSQKIDLITASVTTNLGFDIARRTEEDFLSAYPQFNDYNDVLMEILERIPSLKSDIKQSMSEWLFAYPHTLLASFCTVVEPEVFPLFKRGHHGVYNPDSDRSKMDGEQKATEDRIILVEILQEFCTLEWVRGDPPAQDELTVGLRKMCRIKVIPIWLAFAAQAFLDITHVLRRDVGRGFQDLAEVGSRSKHVIQNYFDFILSARAPDTWNKTNDICLKAIVDTIDMWVSQDVLWAMKKKAAVDNDLETHANRDIESFYLYERHPVLCGLICFSIVLKIQKAGLGLVSACGTAILPAHLYNALRQKHDPIGIWLDMDSILETHGEERIFVGKAPRGIQDSYKRSCLAIGISAESFARKRRITAVEPSKEGPRGLEQSSPILEILREGYCNRGSVALTAHNIEALLNEQANGSVRRQWEKSSKLTSLQLMTALESCILEELPKLMFDYFSFHTRSLELLRNLRSSLHESLVKYIGPQYLDNESQLPFVAMHVLSIASSAQEITKQIRTRAETSSVILEAAGSVVQAFIDEQGGAEVTKVTELGRRGLGLPAVIST